MPTTWLLSKAAVTLRWLRFMRPSCHSLTSSWSRLPRLVTKSGTSVCELESTPTLRMHWLYRCVPQRPVRGVLRLFAVSHIARMVPAQFMPPSLVLQLRTTFHIPIATDAAVDNDLLAARDQPPPSPGFSHVTTGADLVPLSLPPPALAGAVRVGDGACGIPPGAVLRLVRSLRTMLADRRPGAACRQLPTILADVDAGIATQWAHLATWRCFLVVGMHALATVDTLSDWRRAWVEAGVTTGSAATPLRVALSTPRGLFGRPTVLGPYNSPDVADASDAAEVPPRHRRPSPELFRSHSDGTPPHDGVAPMASLSPPHPGVPTLLRSTSYHERRRGTPLSSPGSSLASPASLRRTRTVAGMSGHHPGLGSPSTSTAAAATADAHRVSRVVSEDDRAAAHAVLDVLYDELAAVAKVVEAGAATAAALRTMMHATRSCTVTNGVVVMVVPGRGKAHNQTDSEGRDNHCLSESATRVARLRHRQRQLEQRLVGCADWSSAVTGMGLGLGTNCAGAAAPLIASTPDARRAVVGDGRDPAMLCGIDGEPLLATMLQAQAQGRSHSSSGHGTVAPPCGDVGRLGPVWVRLPAAAAATAAVPQQLAASPAGHAVSAPLPGFSVSLWVRLADSAASGTGEGAARQVVFACGTAHASPPGSHQRDRRRDNTTGRNRRVSSARRTRTPSAGRRRLSQHVPGASPREEGDDSTPVWMRPRRSSRPPTPTSAGAAMFSAQRRRSSRAGAVSPSFDQQHGRSSTRNSTGNGRAGAPGLGSGGGASGHNTATLDALALCVDSSSGKLVLELEVGVPLAGGRDVCATVTCTSELAMARESWVLVTAVVDLRCERGHTPQLRLHVQVPYARDVGVVV